EVFGVDIKPEAIEKGKELRVLDNGSTELEAIKTYEPELVVLATPVRTFLPIAERLKDLITPDCIVSDLGSVKGSLVYRLEEILGNRFVGGHPIAGTEKAGVENALRDLFRGKRLILTPTERTDLEAKEKIRNLWTDIGSVVEEMDPQLHDFVFGAVSHLPHAVAFALMNTIERLSTEIDLFKYPGGGFKDFTRIAASDPIMWRDIFMENSQEVMKAIEAFTSSLQELRKLIEKGKEMELTQYLQRASIRRRSLEEA
ncbi:MAG: prephenate dehydrogenase, partial [Aquificaceae bacterium]